MSDRWARGGAVASSSSARVTANFDGFNSDKQLTDEERRGQGSSQDVDMEEEEGNDSFGEMSDDDHEQLHKAKAKIKDEKGAGKAMAKVTGKGKGKKRTGTKAQSSEEDSGNEKPAAKRHRQLGGSRPANLESDSDSATSSKEDTLNLSSLKPSERRIAIGRRFGIELPVLAWADDSDDGAGGLGIARIKIRGQRRGSSKVLTERQIEKHLKGKWRNKHFPERMSREKMELEKKLNPLIHLLSESLFPSLWTLELMLTR